MTVSLISLHWFEAVQSGFAGLTSFACVGRFRESFGMPRPGLIDLAASGGHCLRAFLLIGLCIDILSLLICLFDHC